MAQQIVPVIGLEKLYIAKIIKDDITGATFDTPKYLAGVKEISVKPKVSTESFYAENILWLSDTTLGDIEVGINITDLVDEEESFLLGHKLATEGGVIKSADDIAPEVAILYKSNKGNGKGRYQVLYKGKFTLGDDQIKGKEGKSNFQSKELKATFQPLHFNKMWQYKVDEDSSSAPADLDTKFFESVIIPTKKVTP